MSDRYECPQCRGELFIELATISRETLEIAYDGPLVQCCNCRTILIISQDEKRIEIASLR